jgi:hypothetical protein
MQHADSTSKSQQSSAAVLQSTSKPGQGHNSRASATLFTTPLAAADAKDWAMKLLAAAGFLTATLEVACRWAEYTQAGRAGFRLSAT